MALPSPLSMLSTNRNAISRAPRVAGYRGSDFVPWLVFGHDYNPAQRSKMLKIKGKYRAWSDGDRRAFEDSKPPLAMLRAYMLGIYAGQRGSDILSMVVSQ